MAQASLEDEAAARAEIHERLREMLGGHVSERKYQQARAELLRSYCSEAIDCRYWDEGVAAWRGVPTVVWLSQPRARPVGAERAAAHARREPTRRARRSARPRLPS